MEGYLPRRLGMIALCSLIAVAPAASAQLVNIQPTNDAQTGGVSVSGLSDANASCVSVVVACAPGVAVSGTGDASGGSAASGTGSTYSSLVSVSGLGKANSSGIAVTTLGDANGKLLSITLMGNATCGSRGPCYAISLTGTTTNGTGISGCSLLGRANMQAWCNQGVVDGPYYMAYDLMG